MISVVSKLNNSLLICFKSMSYPTRLVRGPLKGPVDIIRFKFFKLFSLKSYLFIEFKSIYVPSICDRGPLQGPLGYLKKYGYIKERGWIYFII